MTTTAPPEPLLNELRTRQRFLITSHVNPDGDALGSELGLARILRGLGRGALIWNLDRTPDLYSPLPGSERIHVGEEAPAGYPESFDAVITLECPSLERCALRGQKPDIPLLNIDHHLGNEQYGTVNWVDTAAPAVGEMIYRLAGALKVNLDQATANSLYLALVSDTGGFRHANSTPSAFEAAAELVREGARPEQVSAWLYESVPETAMRLLAEMLPTLSLHSNGRIATTHLTREMFERAGADSGDTEGLIDYPRSVAGVEAVALVRQIGKDRYKVSLRSHGSVDIERIARRLGGGGHRNAAGYEVESADVHAALRQAVDELARALEDDRD